MFFACFTLDMANIKCSELRVEYRTNASAAARRSEEEAPQQSSDNLSDVDANVLDLMSSGKCKTLVFGPSLVSQKLIMFYMEKGFSREGECKPLKEEETPEMLEDEVVVFRDFFIAGLRFPLDPLLPKLLLMLNAKLHHLTPNAFNCQSSFGLSIPLEEKLVLMLFADV